MSVQDFFDEFLIILPGTPPPSKTPNLFGKLAVQKKILMYDPFIKAISCFELNLIPRFKIVDTSSHPDIRSHTGKKIKPGPSMYRTTLDTSTKVTQFNKLELHFELELADTDDPFCDPLSSDIGRTEWEFESQANKGRDCQGQLTKYPIEWCSRGHLTFAFTILIFGSSARFIRWDRSAAVVSEKFSYKMNRQPLGEFLWYFTRMDDVGRGKDDTVREASVEETRTAHDKLKKWKPKLERSVFVFTIQADSNGRDFLEWGSMANGESLIGRATRAYPVRGVQEKVLRFLKDSWRGMHFGSESDILRTLNDACIRNVPQLICGEDIDGHCHSTRSHSFAANYMDENIGPKRMLWECGIHNTMQRVYYRLVSRDIGLHLIRFKSSKDLMQVVYDAFIAHKEAYEKCNILHGDISDKNVMMKENGDGFLNDWDLAKCVTVSRDAEEIPRDHERTGTWQFISTPNLLKPGKVHTAQDDMESFFHLVLYHGIKYLQHTPLRDARATMVKIFDECSIDPAGTCRGGDAKYSMFMNRAHIERNFAFTDNAPLTFWLNFSMGAIKQWIEYEIPPIIPDHAYLQDSHFSRHRATVITEPSQSLDFSRLILKDHTAFVEIWQDVLSHPKWPDNDKTSDQVPPVTAKSLAASSKRARNEAEQESSNKRKKSMSSHHIPIQGSSLRQSRISSGSG
ncbi:hypothetical protein BDZ94DRAFT_1241514 [Collybia nuda]|uniref:Fungal-type protein kinase domain-containing protein n=1 Tax=Collybia nuda TaxID=64659 RepID=A0A9P5XVH2_9AGAR|nr:hypothetical protein BDZ94DRAFT_1241514 [Collybia nuda]